MDGALPIISPGLDVAATIESHAPHVAALAYARAGFPVLPLHTPTSNGSCSCRRDCGRDAGKHPRTRHGLLDATTDLDQIHAWWTRVPDANVGVATGATSRLLVLDVDIGPGDATVDRLEGEHGELPPTWAGATGGGGSHLWYRHPGGPVPTSAGKVGPGVDVRADGGFVVASPSRHRSGERYRWGAGWHPRVVPLADPPAWLLTLIRSGSSPREMIPPAMIPLTGPVGGNHLGTVVGVPVEAIAEGQRNATLASLAGAMRRRGFGEAAILAALLAENTARCHPPLPDPEVTTIAHSVARYLPESGLAPLLGSPRARSRGGFVEYVGGRAVTR